VIANLRETYPEWKEFRLQAELQALGYEVSADTLRVVISRSQDSLS
jgi:hypothetical protein